MEMMEKSEYEKRYVLTHGFGAAVLWALLLSHLGDAGIPVLFLMWAIFQNLLQIHLRAGVVFAGHGVSESINNIIERPIFRALTFRYFPLHLLSMWFAEAVLVCVLAFLAAWMERSGILPIARFLALSAWAMFFIIGLDAYFWFFTSRIFFWRCPEKIFVQRLFLGGVGRNNCLKYVETARAQGLLS